MVNAYPPPVSLAKSLTHKPFVTAMVVPTGLGASQGGYAGDATVWLNLIASVSDLCLTHPNVANAAAFQQLPSNAWYVEGHQLDGWLQGHHRLAPVHQHRLGIVLDAGMEEGMQVLHHNTIAAVQSVYGIAVAGVALTTEPLALGVHTHAAGHSTGYWLNPHAALDPAQHLIEAEGATAIALATRMVEPEDSTYAQGVGPDPIGGLEAILSHTLSQRLGVPCANAPVFDWEAAAPRRDALVAPVTAAEYISATFLPCVLRGLNQAPVPTQHPQQGVGVEALSALVLPHDAMGGLPTWVALERGIPLVAVASNTTVLGLPLEALVGAEQLARLQRWGLYTEVASYLEAAGLLQLRRLGLCPPQG